MGGGRWPSLRPCGRVGCCGGFRESSSARVTISQTLAEVGLWEWSGGGRSGRDESSARARGRVDVEAREGGDPSLMVFLLVSRF